ncbi:MAG: S8 family serine peptidase [candidate division WOR-3 bacterium]
MGLLLVALIVVNESCLVAYQSGTYTPPYLPEYDYIAIAGYYFNPRERLPEIPVELTGESDYYLIHIKGPVYEDMKKTIEAQGVKLIQYIPFNAFIARMDRSKKDLVEGLSFVNWIGNYEPAYKISTLFKELPDEDEWLVFPFPDENIYLLKRKLENLGCKILEISDDDYCRVIKIQSERNHLNTIARMTEVMYIEPYLQPVAYNQSAQWVTQTWKQVDRRIWRKNLMGQGQVVNTADTGILTSHDMFRDPAVSITTWGNYPTHRKIIAYLQPTGSSAAFGDNAGGSWHGTHTAGTICGDDSYVNGTNPNDGMPLKAKMFFMDIGTSTGSLSVPSNLANLYLPPYNGNAGGAARISSHSWGSTSGAGSYTSYCVTTDSFMWRNRDFLICYAAGNSGPGSNTVYPPGTSKNILTVGATMNSTAAIYMADFSSRGPTADNRIKPTVTAPGYFLFSSVGPNNNSYLGMAGTSMATPCAAGNAAIVRQYFAKGFYPSGDSNPANAWSFIPASLVKAIIINGAHPSIAGSTIPDNNTGWGRVCLDDALFFSGDVRKLWVTYDSVATGQFDEFTITVNNQSEPLKITLVWTDYPATAGASVTLVNNLDLRVTSPTGTVYLGNVYSGGQSAPGGSADNRNVEECVRRNVPEIGNWVIRVTGTNVPQGTNQPYALVVSGGLGPTTSPVLHIAGQRIYDPPPGGNFNGRCDAGETVYLIDTLRNLSNVGVTNCVGVLRKTSSYITLIDSVGNFGDIAVGGTAHNGGSPFRFSISSTTPAGTFVDFILHLTGGGGYVQDIEFSLEVGINEVHVIWGPKTVQVAPGDTHFLYGLGYNPQNNRLYVCNFYRRTTGIVMYTSDSNVTYLGTIPAPDSCPTDIKYCAYDNTFWVAADPNPTAPSRIIYKINTSGTVLRQFANPANDYPTGLAWMPTSRWLYAADRRTSAGATPIIYRCDTLGGNVSSVNLTIGDNYGPRGLAIEPYGPDTTLLLVYTHFSSDATPVLLKIVLYELRRSDGAVLNSVTLPGWNVRGVEYDPRDGNYWLTIAQNPNRAIVKILGFRGIPGVGIDEELQPGPLEKISLSPGMPTPFKNTVKFNYSVPVKMRVRLAVYDITGRHVKTFVNGEVEPGTQTIIWNGMDENNKRCASGVYLCYMETEHGSVVRKFVMSK